jgi:hypothetical protein
MYDSIVGVRERAERAGVPVGVREQTCCFDVVFKLPPMFPFFFLHLFLPLSSLFSHVSQSSQSAAAIREMVTQKPRKRCVTQTRPVAASATDRMLNWSDRTQE